MNMKTNTIMPINSPVDWHESNCEQYAGNAYDSDDQ